MLTSQILVALLTTAGIVESRDSWGSLERMAGFVTLHGRRGGWVAMDDYEEVSSA